MRPEKSARVLGAPSACPSLVRNRASKAARRGLKDVKDPAVRALENYNTGVRQKRSHGTGRTQATLFEGAEVADSGGESSGSEGARVSIPAEGESR